MKFFYAAVFLTILAPNGLPAQERDATPLLNDVVATYKSARSYNFETTEEGEFSEDMQRSWSTGRALIAKELERTFCAVLFQLPPRLKRFEPDTAFNPP